MLFSLAVSGLIVITHKGHIERLRSGTENEIGEKKAQGSWKWSFLLVERFGLLGQTHFAEHLTKLKRCTTPIAHVD